MAISVRAIPRPPALRAVGPGSVSGKLSFHYGWVILAVSACLSAAAGFSFQSAGIAFTHLHHHMGWAPGQITLAGSLFFLSAALAGPGGRRHYRPVRGRHGRGGGHSIDLAGSPGDWSGHRGLALLGRLRPVPRPGLQRHPGRRHRGGERVVPVSLWSGHRDIASLLCGRPGGDDTGLLRAAGDRRLAGRRLDLGTPGLRWPGGI